MAVRTPGDEFRKRQRIDILHKLLDDKVVCNAKIRGRESQLRKRQVETVHAKRDLVPQFAEIRLLQAGTVADDEGAFAFMNTLQLSEPSNALAPPGMQIRIGQFGDAAEGIVGVAHEIPKRLWDDVFEGLFHVLSVNSTTFSVLWGKCIDRNDIVVAKDLQSADEFIESFSLGWDVVKNYQQHFSLGTCLFEGFEFRDAVARPFRP